MNVDAIFSRTALFFGGEVGADRDLRADTLVRIRELRHLAKHSGDRGG
jgi:hypothetical protein